MKELLVSLASRRQPTLPAIENARWRGRFWLYVAEGHQASTRSARSSCTLISNTRRHRRVAEGLLEIGQASRRSLPRRVQTRSADGGDHMTSALAIAPDDESARLLSPARRILAEQLAAVARVRSDLERASRPAERLREQLRVADEQLAAAEAERAAIDAQHVAAIRDQAKSDAALELLPKAPGSAKAEATTESARRTRDAVRAALAECEAEVDAARKALLARQVHTDGLLLAVIQEEHADKLDRLAVAREAYVTAEAEALAIGALFGEYGRRQDVANRITWLQAGERAAIIFGKQPGPESTTTAIRERVSSWSAALARMAAGDATASG